MILSCGCEVGHQPKDKGKTSLEARKTFDKLIHYTSHFSTYSLKQSSTSTFKNELHLIRKELESVSLC